MDTFKPAKAPGWKRLLTNPFVHISFVFILVFVAFVFIRQKQNEDLANRVAFLKGGPLIVEQKAEDTENSQEESASLSDSTSEEAKAESNNIVAAPAESAASAAPTPPVAGSESAVAKSAPSAALANNNSVTKSIPTVSIQYLEIENETLQAWSEEARASNTLNRFEEAVVWGSVNNAEEKLKNKKGIKYFEEFNYKNLERGAAQFQVFRGTHKGEDPEQEMGLLADIYAQVEDNLVHLDIEIQRSWREESLTSALKKKSYNINMDLAAGSAAFLSGLLPHKIPFNLTPDLNPDTYLQIYRSKSFQERASEFTLLIKFDKVD